ncbi:putative nuclease HARBI1 [Ostrea edulis]|uniref:putative nuclease HARBI1 n=1 Tax=Ostrea edulis TaxID=37623 RepID=UPI0024AF738B|nr:putative nuclease HARBI1 [Ostrea edulis]
MAALVAFLRRVGNDQHNARPQRRLPRPRVFKDRLNPLDMRPADEELYERYRFRRPTIIFLCGLIEDIVIHPTRRSLALPPMVQLLVFLRFVATGAFHQLIGDSIHLSKSTAGRCIRRVASALVILANRYIIFPTDQNATNTKRKFHNIAGKTPELPSYRAPPLWTPKVVRRRKVDRRSDWSLTENLCDGILIGICMEVYGKTFGGVCPADVLNRKGYHSLNVMMSCDTNFVITNCVAKRPGSCHDSRVFRESTLCRQFENGQHDGLLLGDSGYPCKTYLMTPYNNTNDVRHKERFNSALCRTRVVIEQTYGILKRRFPCLAVGLRTKPDRACQYVVACVVLHNIGILRQDIVTISADDLLIAGPDVQEIDHANNNGFTYRDIIARQCFNQ